MLTNIRIFALRFMTVAAITALVFTQSTSALTSQALDFSNANIDYYQPKDDLTNCGVSSGAVSTGGNPIANFSPDPAAVKQFNDIIKPKIESRPNNGMTLLEIYKAAGDAEGFPEWPMLAGLHYQENSLMLAASTQKYRGPFQMNVDTLQGAGIDVNSPPFNVGHKNSDEDLVVHARAAIKLFIYDKADAPLMKTNPRQPMSVRDVVKHAVAYKSGQGSSWLQNNAATIDGHGYAWAGFDMQHPIGMKWGSSSEDYTGEEQGRPENKLGVAATWGIIKGGNFAVGSGGNCAAGGTGNGTFQPINGTREELVQRALAGGKVVSENTNTLYADDENDIRNNITMKALKLLVGMVEQSGVDKVRINIMQTGYTYNSQTKKHDRGMAFDLTYAGNDPGCSQEGQARGAPAACNNPQGNKLYAYFVNNWEALEIVELFLKDPPPEAPKCINYKGPVPCSAVSADVINGHYHHIHVAVDDGP